MFCSPSQSSNSAPVVSTATPVSAPPAPTTGAAPSSGLLDYLKTQIPTGTQYFLGSLGVKGFPSLRSSAPAPSGNKPTEILPPPITNLPSIQQNMTAQQPQKGRLGNL